jgi:aminocarboxymuconate-semialdehyde decarboxylase
MPVIDIHSHFFPESWPDLSEKFGTPDWPWMRHEGDGKAMVMLGKKEFRPVYDACWDTKRRLEEMDRDGIDLQVICATPILFAYNRPAEHAADCARMFNAAAREICAAGQERLLSLCQVPLQDTDAACKELSRAMNDGHVGVQIGNHVGERNLDDEGIITFLQHCADEGAAVLVHPWDMMGGDRTAKYMMAWISIDFRIIYASASHTAAAASRFCSGGLRMPGTGVTSCVVNQKTRRLIISAGSTSIRQFSTRPLYVCSWKSVVRTR